MTKTRIPEPTIFSNNQEFLRQLLAFKYIYLFCIGLFFLFAFLINTYSVESYNVVSKIRPTKNESTSILSNDLFRGLQAFKDNSEIEDEINNLKSFSTTLSTISQLDFEISYYSEKGKFFKKTKELFNDSPFFVKIDKSHVQPINTKFFIEQISDSTFRLTANQKEVYLYNYIDGRIAGKSNSFNIDTIFKFNAPIRNRNLFFSVTLNKDFKLDYETSSERYYFVLYDAEMVAQNYLGNLSVGRVSQPSSILNVEFRGENIDKNIHFLNNYLLYFFEESLEKKNQMAANTINFIDSQISDVSDSLYVSESKLRDFRSRNQVMDLGYQGQVVFQQMQRVDEEIIKLRTHERYYNFLIDFLESSNNDFSGIVLPTAMNVEDPLITQQLGELLSLNSERSNIIAVKGQNNLFLNEIDSKIRIQKQAILQNVKNNLSTMSLTLNELNYRAQRHSAQISNLPRTEINMVNMQRKFDINDELYTFLLQKRSEAAITMASNFPDFEILEPAREITARRVAPKSMFNYMLALAFGLFLPTLGLVARDFFNTRILKVEFIEHLINRSVLAVLFSNDKKSEKVVEEYFLHPAAESIRALKSSLLMKLPPPSPKIILITSAQPEDGKSYVSYNLAASIALAGHKTVLIDADLRRPSLHKKFNVKNLSGVSSILTPNTNINKIIHKTPTENLSFIPAGPVEKNPAKVFESGVVDALINFLNGEYEYIIIDTTPLGVIVDAVILMKNATHVLIVARKNHTQKELFVEVLNKLESNKVKNFDVIFNDVNFNRSPYKMYAKYYSKTR